VAPGVLIPRPETAELCGWVVSKATHASQLLDIGTGSGCIAITLAAELPHAQVSAWDISDDALRIARDNATRLGVNVTFEKHDILDTSTSTSAQPTYDVIVSNPPYIKPSERSGMAQNVLDYEPDIALFAPEDHPIIFYQKIADFAWHNLRNGGHLFFELNPLTAEAVGDYLRQLGFSDIEFRQDSYHKQRFLKATKI
jgi:release factor glutamine methyltransferase